jgi:hypothetical protein
MRYENNLNGFSLLSPVLNKTSFKGYLAKNKKKKKKKKKKN